MLISIIGIEPGDGSEDSKDPKLQSLTMYSCGGSSLLMDISSTLLENVSILAVTYTSKDGTRIHTWGVKA